MRRVTFNCAPALSPARTRLFPAIGESFPAVDQVWMRAESCVWNHAEPRPAPVGITLADAACMRLKALLGGVILAVVIPAAGSEVLHLKVSPEMSIEPAWIIVQVRVEPDADNRAINIVAESADFLRSSYVQLDGEKATRVSVFQYRDLPAGEYEVRGVLIGRDGDQRAVVRRTFTVRH